MWRLNVSVEAQRTLDVVPGTGRISPSAVLNPHVGRRKASSRRPTEPTKEKVAVAPVASTKSAPRASSSSVRRCGSGHLMDRAPTYWTESAVYAYLSEPKCLPPPLTDIREIMMRRFGGDKMLCIFLNNENEQCTAWVCATHLLRYYPEQYRRARLEFANKFTR